VAVTLVSTGTEYVANSVTLTRGDPSSITRVGVFHTTDPLHIPTPEEFTTVQIVAPTDPLGDGINTDILTLIGPRGDIVLAKGDYQRWILVVTADEDIIRRPDTISVQ
jgi:hypothetical protein